MDIVEFKTSLGLPGISAEVGLGTDFRFESHAHGFGMMWPTHLKIEEAFSRALPILPTPEDEDESTVVRTGEEPIVIPSICVNDVLSDNPRNISLLDVELGSCAILWAYDFGSGVVARIDETLVKVQCDKPGGHVMSLGDWFYRREIVEELLDKTAPEYFAEDFPRLLDRADVVLHAHIADS